MSLGKNVRKLREARGWEQKDLALASGVSNGTISAIEVRDSKRSAVAPALARALGVTLEQLMSDDMDALAPDAPTHEPSNAAPSPVTLEQALKVVARSLNDLPDAQRDLAAQHLQTLARAPDSAKAMQALLAALHCDVPPMPLPESRDFQPPVPPSFLLKNKTTEHHS